MEQPTVSKIMGPGWTYCPRCDANAMVPEGDGWHCPWCGITMSVKNMPPVPSEMMVWSENLTGEELTREYSQIQRQTTKWVADHKDIPPPRPPRRLQWFMFITKPLAWVFGCRVVALKDKKEKEATGV